MYIYIYIFIRIRSILILKYMFILQGKGFTNKTPYCDCHMVLYALLGSKMNVYMLGSVTYLNAEKRNVSKC